MRRLLAVGLLALSLRALAQTQEITEEEYLAGVDDRHPAVRALQEGLAVAEAARIRAGALSNPRAEFWREQPDANPVITNWTIAWAPPFDGRLRASKRAADAGVAAARASLAVDRAHLRQALRHVFARWSLATERVALLAEQADRVRRLAEAERQRARVGEAAGLSARRLDLAHSEVQATLRDGEADLARARAAAHAWRPDLAPGARPLLAMPPDVPAAPSAADSPELRRLTHEIERSEFEAQRAARFWGAPTLQIGWQRLKDQDVVRDGLIVAANWSVPLFDRDRAARVEAGQRGEVAKAQLELARIRVAADVAGEFDAYRTLLVSQREARQVAAESGLVIDAASASYAAGEATLTDLLDALRTAFAARTRELEIRASAWEAHRNLETALGRPLSGGGL
jgi:cobalt-zinc-cadmium efflux system outer membrane protein